MQTIKFYIEVYTCSKSVIVKCTKRATCAVFHVRHRKGQRGKGR